ncbi:MAG: ubiquinol-cytochrome C chaperone family protein [Alphaproteobacteria bacterium]|nr:ubiquinol-cytochrome C chaperone family protein [Alphaproteobacteria bacterium]
MFGFLSKRALEKREVSNLYEKAVTHARQPVFYSDYGVPDTVDGRFELICLHTALIIRSLQKTGEDKKAQSLFDVMFMNMDKSLREMGVGDLSVPKHMKRMMKGFKGRAMHYIDAIEKDDLSDLKQAVKRNVYGTAKDIDDNNVDAIASYIVSSAKLFDNMPVISSADLMFSEIALNNNEERKSA